jgi:glycosyltransferase involved in cell wall biosynthesis
MKVLLLTDGIYPMCVGGMQKHSTNLYINLVEQGLDVHLVTCTLKDEIIEIPQFVNRHNLMLLEFPNSWKFPGHYILNSIRYSYKIWQLYKNRLSEFDLIYAQGFTSFAFGNCKEIPIVSNLHGLEMFQRSFSLKSIVQNFFLRVCSCIIIRRIEYSESLGGNLTSILRKQSARNIFLGGNGVLSNWIKEDAKLKSGNRFLYIGRKEKRKGFEGIVRVVKNQFIESLKLTVVGFDSETHDFSNNIVYLGEIKSENKIIEILDNHEFLIMNSFSEGLPTVVIEAMARGLVVITTDVGAISEIVSAETGFLFNAGDDAGLAIVIENALNLTDMEYILMSKNCISNASNLQWSLLVKKYIDGFKKILYLNEGLINK